MDVGFQHLIHGGIHQAVAGHGGDSAKGLGDDTHSKVALAAGGAGMAGVEVTFVRDVQFQGGEAGDQQVVQTPGAAGWGGSAGLGTAGLGTAG
jgi:hypothetical protein